MTPCSRAARPVQQGDGVDSIVTWATIAITVLVSWAAFNNRALLERLILWPPAIARHRQYDRLVTHGFIHADGMHLLFNMVTLYFFGTQLEPFFADYIGPWGYAAFYLSAIVIAIMPTYLRHQRDPHYRSLGASGAVSAVLFAFILLAPWSSIYVFLIPIGIPAFVFGGLYLGYTIWMDRRGGGNINHSAHLWGAVYGMLFTVMMEPRAATTFLARLTQPAG
jgi:membrane associated rhomboid family serine protease